MNRILSGVLAAALLLPCAASPPKRQSRRLSPSLSASHRPWSPGAWQFSGSTSGPAARRSPPPAPSPTSPPSPGRRRPGRRRAATGPAPERRSSPPDLPLTQQALAAVLYRMAGSPALESPGLLERQTISGWDDWGQERRSLGRSGPAADRQLPPVLPHGGAAGGHPGSLCCPAPAGHPPGGSGGSDPGPPPHRLPGGAAGRPVPLSTPGSAGLLRYSPALYQRGGDRPAPPLSRCGRPQDSDSDILVSLHPPRQLSHHLWGQ